MLGSFLSSCLAVPQRMSTWADWVSRGSMIAKRLPCRAWICSLGPLSRASRMTAPDASLLPAHIQGVGHPTGTSCDGVVSLPPADSLQVAPVFRNPSGYLHLCLVLLGWCLVQTSNVAAQDEEDVLAEAIEVFEADAGDVQAFFPAMVGAPARDLGAPLEFVKPLVNLEISFIKRVCEPTDEQMTEIVAAAKQAYEATGDMVQDPQQAIRVDNRVQIMGPGNEQLKENPYRRVRRDAAKYLQAIVSEEQYDRYQAESKQRDEFERAAVVGTIVALIDDKIAMTEQQRAEMTELMTPLKDGFDLQSMQVYIYNPQYLPKIPVSVVNKVFDERQLKAWKSMNSVMMSFTTSFNGAQEFSLEEEWIQ
ncbi:hypothetical protein Poly21_00750 [Allorhodopirellula heiligendammensis]|uniref:Uncharacterized protein n=2 Tax=Allorhodopirellula heiligendammensis TaxID=2714739 RepID=A0A5C6C063_9BACT|nr:hypothetical protein Poly21_00750 [Allorhodopirellula heiligendammensis]